jgi:hypothetical protein
MEGVTPTPSCTNGGEDAASVPAVTRAGAVSVFFELARYILVKITHSCSEVVL